VALWNFAYGSHLFRSQFCSIIGGQPEQATPAALFDHRLTFRRILYYPPEYAHLADGGGGPALLPQRAGIVHGVLYRISQEQFEQLDRYERDWGYASVACHVKAKDGKQVQALAHTLPLEGAFCPPTQDFLSLMLQGAQELGYGPEVIQAIQRAAAQEKPL